ncbi:MAG: rhamnulokinase, partial [Acidimicrobiales bacterium]
VVAGPLEASAIGNLLVQLRAAGLVGGRDEMRDLVDRSFRTRRVAPGEALVLSAQRAAARLGVAPGVRGGS